MYNPPKYHQIKFMLLSYAEMVSDRIQVKKNKIRCIACPQDQEAAVSD